MSPSSSKLEENKSTDVSTVENALQNTTHTNMVQFSIGTKEYLEPLFRFYYNNENLKDDDDTSSSNNMSFIQHIEYSFMNTINRDGFDGSWAHVWSSSSSQSSSRDKHEQEYHLKITSPLSFSDITPYKQIIPKYLEIISIAERACSKRWTQLSSIADYTEEMKKKQLFKQGGLQFLPPFGLPMIKSQSVLLMHYPPIEAISYKDYLHSRTTKRWETLLLMNLHSIMMDDMKKQTNFTVPSTTNHYHVEKYMSIVDICPIVSRSNQGGSRMVGAFCEPIQPELESYVVSMLNLLLSNNTKDDDDDNRDERIDTATSSINSSCERRTTTKPLIAFGYAVNQWLMNNKMIRGQILEQRASNKKRVNEMVEKAPLLKSLDVFELRFDDTMPPSLNVRTTPMLFLDHPSGYYRTPDTSTEWRKDRLRSDLIGAWWQIQMCCRREKQTTTDSHTLLDQAKKYWQEGGRREALFQRYYTDHEEQFRTITSNTQP